MSIGQGLLSIVRTVSRRAGLSLANMFEDSTAFSMYIGSAHNPVPDSTW